MAPRLAACLIGLGLAACQPSWPAGLELPPPVQGELPADAPTKFMFKDHVVQPVATYEVTALVLSKMSYHLDRAAEVSGTDLALGWGVMADKRVLDQMRVRQNDRYYFTSFSHELPYSLEELNRSAANTHLVVGSRAAQDVIDEVDPGEVIHLEGALVHVTGKDGWEIRSSLTREDKGGGACEVLWVDRASLVP